MSLKHLVACLFLTGCAGNDVEPDPVGPTILEETVTVEVPVPVERTPPADLLQPLNLDAPQVLPAGHGDYGISRINLERMIEAHRAAAERLARWRAWAQ